MLINQKDLVELHNNLDPYFNELLKNSKLSKLILKKVKIFRLLSLALIFCVLFSIIFYVVTPLIFIIKRHYHQMKITKYPLIYPSGYPWKITSSGFIYQIHFAFETLASLALFFVTTSIDSLFTLYIFQMIGQLREISYCITHIDEDENENKDSVVRKCVTQYEKLMRCREILETIYGPVILWIMGTNAIVLCTLLFQISQVWNILKIME